MAKVFSFLIRYFSNYYTLHRSDLAARAAPLDLRLNILIDIAMISIKHSKTPQNKKKSFKNKKLLLVNLEKKSFNISITTLKTLIEIPSIQEYYIEKINYYWKIKKIMIFKD